MQNLALRKWYQVGHFNHWLGFCSALFKPFCQNFRAMKRVKEMWVFHCGIDDGSILPHYSYSLPILSGPSCIEIPTEGFSVF